MMQGEEHSLAHRMEEVVVQGMVEAVVQGKEIEHSLAHSMVAQSVVHRVGEAVVQGMVPGVGKAHSIVHKRSCRAGSKIGHGAMREEEMSLSDLETRVRTGIPTVL